MNKDWDVVIEPRASVFDLKLQEVWRYRDLFWLFVKRDIAVGYKQTILGPLWYVIQPILTTLMFTFIFGKLANISTGGIPHVLFYFSGITLWNYFSDCLNKTSNTFVINQNVFGKVYFPRSIVPGSIIVSNLVKFAIQFVIFLFIWGYYWRQGMIGPHLNAMLLFPFIVVVLGLISLGFGMIFSSLTTKYRDLTFLLSFGIQLWMYATPVIYPLSAIPSEYSSLIRYNPISSIIEFTRYAFLGQGHVMPGDLAYSFAFSIVIFFMGYLIFSRVEKSFMDNV